MGAKGLIIILFIHILLNTMKKRQEVLPHKKLNESHKSQTPLKSLEIVEFLYENVFLQNKMDYYSSLDIKSLQNLLGVSFRKNNLSQEKQFFVYQLLKKHTFIINIAFNHDKFNFNTLVQFINQNRLEYVLLNLLQDILVPFCRKSPHRILQLFTRDKKIKETLLKHIYLKHIFKILYTTVFCCQKNFIDVYRQVLMEIMNCMINSIFQFITYPSSLKKTLKLLQFGEITQNLKVFLLDLCNNLVSVQFVLVDEFITLLHNNFLQRSFQFFEKYKEDDHYQQYCQGIIQIHIYVLRLKETVVFSHENFTADQNASKKIIDNNLLKYTDRLGDKLQYLLNICVQNNNKKRQNFSSGERIQTVGLIRYRILQLIEKLLNLNQITPLEIHYDKLDFIPLFDYFLQRFKWNNIVQVLLYKIFQTIICQDYNSFILKHLMQEQSSPFNLFENLIVNFRNRKFLFLHSLRLSFQGNRSILFQICKNLINQMQEKSHLNMLFKKFPFWKEFIEKDMKIYEELHYEKSKEFNEILDNPMTGSKKIIRRQSIETGYNAKSLQTIEQILLHLKQEEKWSPDEIKLKKRMTKNQLLEHQDFKKMDSLIFHENLK